MMQFHNTLTGKKEPFVPHDPNEVRMYVCGITPYDASHLGHARCYVVFDIFRRTLKAHGFKIKAVQNFTDVDDKIIDRARERGISPQKLAQDNIDDYFSKMDALGVERVDLYPRVTDHMPEIIALIQKIIDHKAAYTLNGDVYFSVRDFPSYGKLSKRHLDELQSGARVEVNKEKRDPLDFALWKAAKPNEPAEVVWDSPWGKGRPGWHIECSAMSLKHLGANFDIHGGGRDLIFPHHENEIAQSEAGTGQPFVKLWMHNGFVTVNKEKMSKSLGNFFSLSDIFKSFSPMVVRYMLLTVHYRSPLDFSQDLLTQSRQTIGNIKEAIARANEAIRGMAGQETPEPEIERQAEALLSDFKAALADDLNTPEALGVLHRMVALIEKPLQGKTPHAASARAALMAFQSAASILGLDLAPSDHEAVVPAEVISLSEQRLEARRQKNWAEADRLRQKIADAGYVVEDTAQGPRLLPKVPL
jgi:cysteinyl-tRNA synthetase